MASDAFKDIEKLETDLWEAADNLRANSKLTSSDYFMPVLGVIFLRHAANRFDAAHRQIEADQASGKMPKRKVLPADYIARRSLYLPEKARYDWIMQQAAVSGADLPKLVTDAMTAIEAEFEPLLGVLRRRRQRFGCSSSTSCMNRCLARHLPKPRPMTSRRGCMTTSGSGVPAGNRWTPRRSTTVPEPESVLFDAAA